MVLYTSFLPPSFFKKREKKAFYPPSLSKSICTACILSAGQHSLFFVGGGIRLLFFSPPPSPSFFHFRDILNFLISLRLLSRAYFLIFISEAKTLSLLSTHPQSKIRFIPFFFLVLLVYFGKNLQRSSGFYCRWYYFRECIGLFTLFTSCAHNIEEGQTVPQAI